DAGIGDRRGAGVGDLAAHPGAALGLDPARRRRGQPDHPPALLAGAATLSPAWPTGPASCRRGSRRRRGLALPAVSGLFARDRAGAQRGTEPYLMAARGRALGAMDRSRCPSPVGAPLCRGYPLWVP